MENLCNFFVCVCGSGKDDAQTRYLLKITVTNSKKQLYLQYGCKVLLGIK